MLLLLGGRCLCVLASFLAPDLVLSSRPPDLAVAVLLLPATREVFLASFRPSDNCPRRPPPPPSSLLLPLPSLLLPCQLEEERSSS